MTPLAKAILDLHAAEEISQNEIARRLGCTSGRVSQVISENQAKRPLPASTGVKGAKQGENLADPNRADKLLRRFSFQKDDD